APPPPISPLFPYTTLFRSADVTQTTAVRPAAGRLQLGDDLHRPHLWRAGHGAARKRRPQQIAGTNAWPQSSAHLGDEMVDVAIRSEEHTAELQSPYELVCR